MQLEVREYLSIHPDEQPAPHDARHSWWHVCERAIPRPNQPLQATAKNTPRLSATTFGSVGCDHDSVRGIHCCRGDSAGVASTAGGR